MGGIKVFDTTGDHPKKIYRGQQLVIFGRYEKAGPATVELQARLTGEDKVYTTTFDFPEVDTDNPEIERLWAMSLIEQLEFKASIGEMPPSESDDAIEHLGVQHQLVTDHTSMVVLDDDSFTRRGIERRNQQRTAAEHAAQSARAAAPVKSYRVDTAQPTYSQPAPHISRGSGGGGGGGALEREDVVLIVFIGLLLWATQLGRNHLVGRVELRQPAGRTGPASPTQNTLRVFLGAPQPAASQHPAPSLSLPPKPSRPSRNAMKRTQRRG